MICDFCHSTENVVLAREFLGEHLKLPQKTIIDFLQEMSKSDPLKRSDPYICEICLGHLNLTRLDIIYKMLVHDICLFDLETNAGLN